MDDPYAAIADLYDFTYDDFSDDVDFYDNLAQTVDGPLLELGTGTGRVALQLARRGYQVTGIDNSPSMLDRARRNLESAGKLEGSLELIPGDMAAFDLGRRFAMVYLAANTFQHLLSTADQQACLRCVAMHLQPGGVFAMGVRAPASVSWDMAAGEWAPLLLHWTRRDPKTGDKVMKFVADQPDPERMVRRLTYVFDRVAKEGAVRRSVFETELRHSTQAELTLLLQQVGLRVTHVYGDYDLAPVGIGENLVFVARAEAPA